MTVFVPSEHKKINFSFSVEDFYYVCQN